MVAVEVRDGVVTLVGRTDRYSTAQLAVRLTQAVPGVVRVVDGLGYEFDDRRVTEANDYGPAPLAMPYR